MARTATDATRAPMSPLAAMGLGARRGPVAGGDAPEARVAPARTASDFTDEWGDHGTWAGCGGRGWSVAATRG